MAGFTRSFPFFAFALWMAASLLATPVWGQLYAAGRVGFANYSGEAPAVAPGFANDGSGTVVGIEVGVEPGDRGYGYSLGYGRYPYGEKTSSTIDLGLKYVPGDGTIWYDFSLGRGSSDAGRATGLTVGVYAEFQYLMPGSAFAPYGGLVLGYSNIEFDSFTTRISMGGGTPLDYSISCDKDSPISPSLEVGAKRAMSDTAELNIGLTYFTQSIEVQCEYTPPPIPSGLTAINAAHKVKNSGLVALVSYKHTF